MKNKILLSAALTALIFTAYFVSRQSQKKPDPVLQHVAILTIAGDDIPLILMLSPAEITTFKAADHTGESNYVIHRDEEQRISKIGLENGEDVGKFEINYNNDGSFSTTHTDNNLKSEVMCSLQTLVSDQLVYTCKRPNVDTSIVFNTKNRTLELKEVWKSKDLEYVKKHNMRLDKQGRVLSKHYTVEQVAGIQMDVQDIFTYKNDDSYFKKTITNGDISYKIGSLKQTFENGKLYAEVAEELTAQ